MDSSPATSSSPFVTGDSCELAPDDILRLLETRCIGRDVVVFKETSSTNDRIRQAGLAGAAEGLVMFADSQTAGRGTYGRKWISTPGAGLWFSILLRSTLPIDQLPLLVQIAALAVAEAVEEWLPERVDIKLPNDLYLRGGKLAGFLLESSNGWDFQVLGIGINVREAPKIPDYPTAAMEEFAARFINRNEFAARILSRFEQWYLERRPEEWASAFGSRCSLSSL
jgi:BirA family biotin operon repressor/biotin-[acetyl-CoA-carboxylase] ligase